jgi:hypothetical protein
MGAKVIADPKSSKNKHDRQDSDLPPTKDWGFPDFVDTLKGLRAEQI